MVLRKYILANKIISIAVFYFATSIILKIGYSIDVLIPCLWKTLLHIECPGCGLTRAFIEIIKLDLVRAFHTNPLIFVVVIFGASFVYFDFMKFKRKQQSTLTPKV